MKSLAIIFGSNTDNTKDAANILAEKLADFSPKLIDVADASESDLEAYDALILGTSTWGIGDLQDDWEMFTSNLESASLSGKVIALFGLGDAEGYPDTFVNGMGTIYEAISGKGCKIVGSVDTADYSYGDSTAVVNGQFVGLPLDADNESDKTEDRIEAWVNSFKAELN